MFIFTGLSLVILLVIVGIIALVAGLVVWAVRRPMKVMSVPMNTQQPNAGQFYQGPPQPGAQPPYPGADQQPSPYPGQSPAQDPLQ